MAACYKGGKLIITSLRITIRIRLIASKKMSLVGHVIYQMLDHVLDHMLDYVLNHMIIDLLIIALQKMIY